ncbi:pyridoxal phosphate-dependent transferase [Lactarius pseudohatsudake]|nr:pyridoxal phosphate-dependent transferase [Lactarius pseudohatsudake]
MTTIDGSTLSARPPRSSLSSLSDLYSHIMQKEQSDLASVPVDSGANGPRPKLANAGKQVLNLVSYNFTGLAIKVRAIETLRKYGVGSCGPPGFYCTTDVHMDLERDIADFLGSTIRCFDHNDLKNLEDVLLSVEKERRKRRGPLRRRFILTEGIFEKDGAMVDPPKLIELKHKYKYQLYSVHATQIDMTVGSVAIANGLNSSGGFCAGLRIVVDHQRINGTSFVFSAAVRALLAVSASEGINILRNTPSIL